MDRVRKRRIGRYMRKSMEREGEREAVTRQRREKTEGGLVWCVCAVCVFFFFFFFFFLLPFFIPGKCFQVQVMTIYNLLLVSTTPY